MNFTGRQKPEAFGTRRRAGVTFQDLCVCGKQLKAPVWVGTGSTETQKSATNTSSASLSVLDELLLII